MAEYRIFVTGEGGHINAAEILKATTDKDAMRLANQFLEGKSGELWLGGRIICRFASPPDRYAR